MGGQCDQRQAGAKNELRVCSWVTLVMSHRLGSRPQKRVSQFWGSEVQDQRFGKAVCSQRFMTAILTLEFFMGRPVTPTAPLSASLPLSVCI